MRHVLVVGHGMVGARFVDELIARDPAGRLAVTVLGAEPCPPYSRVLLADVLAGRHRVDSIALPAAYRRSRPRLEVRSGVEVTAIDPAGRTVAASDGTTTGYDVLVLATGADPLWPAPLVRAGCGPPVYPLRDLADCTALLDALAGVRRAVVVGGGPLGIGAARALAGRGVNVDLVHQARHLMERHLDQDAGAMLAATLGRLGVTVHLSARVRAMREGGVTLTDRRVLVADLILLACGVRPRVGLARAAGLAVREGVVVDDRLRSVSHPRIHAIGDCAEHRGVVHGLVGPGWEQAAVLATRLSGQDATAAYHGSPLVTRLTAAGIDVAAFGESRSVPQDAEVVRFADATRGAYRKAVIRENRLVGGILVGDLDAAGALTLAYERGTPVHSDHVYLLTSPV